ncbi:MAG: IPT/TIG domain-containing protein, partial [Bradymonadaceae bacterium]
MCAVGVAGCGSGGGGNATTEASDVGPQGSDTKTEDATELDAATGLSLESVQPAQGPASGGTEVLLAGRGFESGATVEFGGKSASEVEFVSSTEIAATTPPADAQGPVDVRVESGGESDTLEDGFTYREDEKPASIGWCKLQHPPLIDTKVGKKAGPIAGRVYVEDCTKGSQKCEKVTAQVGVGPSDGDPTASPGDFDWTDASYNADHTSDNNDEYLASVTPKKEGTFAYVYRFSLEGKDEWTYCDLN